jgi:hypothetical protein
MMASSEAGEPGLVLDAPRPVSRLAEAMERMLDGEVRQRMAASARRVAEGYPQERNFQEMLDCLTRAAKKPEGRP